MCFGGGSSAPPKSEPVAPTPPQVLTTEQTAPAPTDEDNTATITVVNAGYSPQLRYMAKHHRISLGLVHEMCQHDDIDLQHIETAKQKGDILTKGLPRPKHDPAMHMVGLYPIIVDC